ncbi:MAG: hypothetical protein K1X57_01475 [Gemmataceae bacterium]|nr:hypothetical protein [Gemmataceae bacterium]
MELPLNNDSVPVCGERSAIIAVVDVALPALAGNVSSEIQTLIGDADRRIAELIRSRRFPAFIPSDFELVAKALEAITDEHLATGQRFCEWGCGLGPNVCIASLLGFDATGIEIELELVEQARQLAADHHIDSEFIHGSFVPEGSDELLDRGGTFAWLSQRHVPASENFVNPDETDVVFAFPWTDEEGLIPDLFNRHAGEGALLLTYHGCDGVRLRRKVPGPLARKSKRRLKSRRSL